MADERAPGKAAHLALRGANLLDQAADKLVSGGWIETGLLVLLVGRAVVAGHRLVRRARRRGAKVRRLELVAHVPPDDAAPPSGSGGAR